MPFARTHLLGLEGLDREDLTFLLDTAASFKEISERDIKKVPTLRGKTVVSVFYEASTRTRASFEIAAKRMSADAVNISVSTSSVSKGETLADTALTLDAMQPDCIVVRHSSAGVPHQLARISKAAIINAGDGANEHPTQALLDAMTIREHKQRIEGLQVAILGDILHSRVARSNIHLLTKLGATVRVAGPRTLVPEDFAHIVEDGLVVTDTVEEAIEDTDVVMILRIQKERQDSAFFPTLSEYAVHYGLTQERLVLAKDDAIVLHPGPMNRGIEIASEVADSARSQILDQVKYGVTVRMAVLYLATGGRAVREDEQG